MDGSSDCTSLEAELWDIFRGLEMVHQQDMEAVKVDSDCAVAVGMINEEYPKKKSPHKVLIEE